MKKLFALMSVVLVTGCIQSYQLLKSGDTKMWNSYTVATSENINELKTNNFVSWSQYGPLLEQIRFFKPIADGDKIPFTYKNENAAKVPSFRTGMTPEEVVEIYRSSVTLGGSILTAVSDLEPVTVGNAQGYAFEAKLSSPKGKDFKGKVIFSERAGKLYLIELGAHATHYYDSRLGFFDGVITSIKF